MPGKIESIVDELTSYINAQGGQCSAWYVGITSDPETRLFNDHGVKKEEDAWIYIDAIFPEMARSVEKYFVDVLSTDGETGGGDEDSKYVYAYKKNAHTTP